MHLSDYDYHLPEGLIASEPSSPRDACRLMILGRNTGAVSHDNFFHIGRYLRRGDVLVLNRSRVIPARLLFQFQGRECEIFLTRKIGPTDWICMVRPGKFFGVGEEFELQDGVGAKVTELRRDGLRILRFNLSEAEFDSYLNEYGSVPLPPYIGPTRATFDDYQTVYSKEEGSVAAPTAGLHFTKQLLLQLQSNGVQIEFVTLHVGLGTFLPIKSEDIRSHTMHSELYDLEPQVAKRLTRAKIDGRRIIAVGTTSVRVLETSFSEGEKKFRAGKGETDIFIREGYRWKCVDGLVTNFHLPKSTLLVLVSAFAGRKAVMHAYNEAIRHHYRFYSFGDAMFIF